MANDALPVLPEPQEQAPVQEGPAIEIEREDDTPEQDRGRGAPPPDVYTSVDDESQDSVYSGKVQGRLKQLRHVYHEERRQKESAQREREALVGYAQSLQAEVEKLRGLVSSGERVLIDQAQGRAEALVNNAKEAYRRAHDSGDSDEVVKAQEQLARAVAEHERYKVMRPSMPQQAQAQPPQQQAVPAQQAEATPDQQAMVADAGRRYQDWSKTHVWHRQPGYEHATLYLESLDSHLRRQGIFPGGVTGDTYWATVNQSLQTSFPQLAGSGSGNANGNGQPLSSPQARARPVTATSGNRPGGSPVKVRLTESMIRMANRLGVTPEQYAREKLKLDQQQNG